MPPTCYDIEVQKRSNSYTGVYISGTVCSGKNGEFTFCERFKQEFLFLAGTSEQLEQENATQTRELVNGTVSPGIQVKVIDMRNALVWILGLLHLCRGQTAYENDRRFGNRRPVRPLGIHHPSSSPCWGGGGGHADIYDSVEDDADGRSLLLLGGAAVGGAAVGYHLGMKHKPPVVINNNIHNEYPSPCVVVQHGGGGSGGGGLISGILGHHPILSNILQGGLWNGGGGGAVNRLPVNRQSDINWNRAIRQFNRAISRVFR